MSWLSVGNGCSLSVASNDWDGGTLLMSRRVPKGKELSAPSALEMEPVGLSEERREVSGAEEACDPDGCCLRVTTVEPGNGFVKVSGCVGAISAHAFKNRPWYASLRSARVLKMSPIFGSHLECTSATTSFINATAAVKFLLECS